MATRRVALSVLAFAIVCMFAVTALAPMQSASAWTTGNPSFEYSSYALGQTMRIQAYWEEGIGRTETFRLYDSAGTLKTSGTFGYDDAALFTYTLLSTDPTGSWKGTVTWRTINEYGQRVTMVSTEYVTVTPGGYQGVPTLLIPANGATNIALTSTLTWTAPSGANYYEIYIYTLAGWSATHHSNTNSIVFTLSPLTTWYWRVRASPDTGSTYGPWSTTWSFTTTSPSQTLNLIAGTPSCWGPTGVQVTYGIVTPSYPFTVRCSLSVVSTYPVSGVAARLSIDGVKFSDITGLTIQPGTPVVVEWTNVWDFDEGARTVTVDVNPDRTIVETSYSDNAKSTVITLLSVSGDFDSDAIMNYEEYTWGTDMIGGFQRWAVIVVGGEVDGSQQEDFDNEGGEAYLVLVGRGYAEDHIYFMSPHDTFDADNDGLANDQDAVATTANVQWAIETWLDRSDRDDRVFIYLVDHGAKERFYVSDGYVTSSNTGTWVSGVLRARMIFVIEACYSGSWLDNIGASIFISSSASNKQASPDPGTHWPAFSHMFFELLATGTAIQPAFWTAHDHANAVSGQDPQIHDQLGENWWP